MFIIGEVFILVGKTKKGKNRVNECGNQWKLLDQAVNVSFTSERGPWLLLESINMPNSMRWIHATNDPDFLLSKEVKVNDQA